ncbi:SWIM zinc finger family protein [Streptomyces sp. Ag109_G2-15]|uniref:SWIM zinc finger family protein n=1 Tax=Streptomyces sp. Ag109_G2-15 TaxID=1938850 RepID=UPI000BD2D51B|nr:SWIM zinc finger family protein [Streptomyces sp. Ag109_G2-15]SOD88940.1 SWIM zinc finger [Streptomyces sp. Ag109_G2-15]
MSQDLESEQRVSAALPPVAPSVTAELVAALSPRLRKRLDAGTAKLADRPAVRDGDTVRIAVDDSTDVELHAPGGTVTSAEAIRCGCLLAPDCLHRAAAASAAPIAEPIAAADSGAVETGSQEAVNTTEPERATPQQCAAARAVHAAATAVLEAGTDGSGAVLQAELLRAAHTARLAGLPRAAATAVSVVTALRAARSADPAYRLADLVTALRDALSAAHRIPHAEGPELTELRGTVRQPYRPDGSLRLYGLFSEPVLTASGYAGAVTWTADAEGRLFQVSDVAPGGAGRATGAADRAVRVGDTALTHRELSRAGLAVSGATVSPTGRLGAGAGVRAVRASGADWREEPLDRLWAVPVADQVSRALSGGHDLLFLEVTLTGTVREAAGDCLLADCGGVPLRLTAAHDHPALPHRDNLRLLAAARGSRLRVVARLVPAPHPRAQLLATEHPTLPGTRVDAGLDRLLHADLPASPAPPAATPTPDEAPVHLLRRRVHQAASGGRLVLSFPGNTAADVRRLSRHGLATAGDLVDELHAAAAERSRDVFGRLLPADTDRFARAWLAAARYTDEVDRALCAAAWGA